MVWSGLEGTFRITQFQAPSHSNPPPAQAAEGLTPPGAPARAGRGAEVSLWGGSRALLPWCQHSEQFSAHPPLPTCPAARGVLSAAGGHCHVVLGCATGTEKVRQAQDCKDLHVVNPDWLWSCLERWDKVEEQLFPLRDDYIKTHRWVGRAVPGAGRACSRGSLPASPPPADISKAILSCAGWVTLEGLPKEAVAVSFRGVPGQAG